MKKILFISNDFFIPACKNGSSIINANIFLYLSKQYEIDFVSTCDPSNIDNEDFGKALGYVNSIRFFPRKNKAKLTKFIKAIADTAMGRPFEESLFFSSELESFIFEADESSRYDLFFFDLHYTSIYYRNIKTKSIISPHDSLSLLYNRFYRTEKNVFLKGYFKFRSKVLRRYEAKIFPLFNKVLFVSDIDASYVKKFCCFNSAVIANGTELPTKLNIKHKELLEKTNEIRLSFWGDLAYRPNKECVEILCSQIIPDLNKSSEYVFKLSVIGRGASQELLSYQNINIEFLGFVEDIGQELSRTDLFICPMISGAGIKNKVLEAMAYRIPTVGTSFAFDGTDCKHNEHAIIVDSVSDIASAVLKLFEDKIKLTDIVDNAHDLVVSQYTWEGVAKRYSSELMGVINESN